MKVAQEMAVQLREKVSATKAEELLKKLSIRDLQVGAFFFFFAVMKGLKRNSAQNPLCKWLTPYQQRAPDMLHQLFLGVVMYLLESLKNKLSGVERHKVDTEMGKIHLKGLRVSIQSPC